MFINIYRCVNCKKELSYDQAMYSNGRCPKCGHKGENACTIVDCDEEAKEVKGFFATSEAARILIVGAVFFVCAALLWFLTIYVASGFLSDIMKTYSKG